MFTAQPLSATRYEPLAAERNGLIPARSHRYTEFASLMMRQMRDNMKWIMLITALSFVGLMVFGWGMDITGRSNAAATGGEMGRVNGDPIFYQEWLTAYRNLYEQQQRSQPGQPVGAAMVRQLEESAWEQLVTQKLINQ